MIKVEMVKRQQEWNVERIGIRYLIELETYLGDKMDPKKKHRFTTREPLYDKKGFEFTGQTDDNSLEDIINELKPYIRRYKPDKNVHYHLYQWDKGGAFDTLF